MYTFMYCIWLPLAQVHMGLRRRQRLGDGADGDARYLDPHAAGGWARVRPSLYRAPGISGFDSRPVLFAFRAPGFGGFDSRPVLFTFRATGFGGFDSRPEIQDSRDLTQGQCCLWGARSRNDMEIPHGVCLKRAWYCRRIVSMESGHWYGVAHDL